MNGRSPTHVDSLHGDRYTTTTGPLSREPRTANQWTANCEPRAANCELRTANCELRIANCELRQPVSGSRLRTHRDASGAWRRRRGDLLRRRGARLDRDRDRTARVPPRGRRDAVSTRPDAPLRGAHSGKRTVRVEVTDPVRSTAA